MALELDPIRARRDAYRDAYARMLRATEPNSDRAEDRAPAIAAWHLAAINAAQDVESLLEAILAERTVCAEALATMREQAAEIKELRETVFTLTNSEDSRAFIAEQERDQAIRELADLKFQLRQQARQRGHIIGPVSLAAAQPLDALDCDDDWHLSSHPDPARCPTCGGGDPLTD